MSTYAIPVVATTWIYTVISVCAVCIRFEIAVSKIRFGIENMLKRVCGACVHVMTFDLCVTFRFVSSERHLWRNERSTRLCEEMNEKKKRKILHFMVANGERKKENGENGHLLLFNFIFKYVLNVIYLFLWLLESPVTGSGVRTTFDIHKQISLQMMIIIIIIIVIVDDNPFGCKV